MLKPDQALENEEKTTQHIEKKKKHLWFHILADILFWIGASASALQGFFSIESFIASLGAIPGMAFLHLIPYAFIFMSATIICLYAIIVEQQIFREHFKRLLAQLFGIELEEAKSKDKEKDINEDNQANKKIKKSDNRTFNTKTKELKLKIHNLANISQRKVNEENEAKKVKYNLLWFLNIVHKSFAYIAASCIVGLRALVSIGSTMLGIRILIGLVISPLGLTAPAAIIPLCALMAGFGYFIKTSQNLVDQFNETLKLLGLKRYVKTDYKKVKKDYKQRLKNIYLGISEKEQKTQKNKKDKKNSEGMPAWKKTISLIMDVGFVFGALGASMQGFFSIKKFVSQMGSVPFLAFFNTIPGMCIIGASAIIAIYTLFVEQKILYQYFHSLVVGWLKPTAGQTKNCIETDIKPDPESDYKLRAIRKGDYTIETIKQEDGTEKYKIIFKTREAYKVYKYNNKIDNIYKDELFTSSNIVRDQNLINEQQPKIKADKKYNVLWLNFARIGTIFILLLRAATSIGPSVLGLSMLVNLITVGIGIGTLGPWLFLPCIIMASFGYMIKCSQNVKNHYRNTMRDMFRVDTSDGYQDPTKLKDKLNDEHITVLEKFNELRKARSQKLQQEVREKAKANQPLSPNTTMGLVKDIRGLMLYSAQQEAASQEDLTNYNNSSPRMYNSAEYATPTSPTLSVG